VNSWGYEVPTTRVLLFDVLLVDNCQDILVGCIVKS